MHRLFSALLLLALSASAFGQGRAKFSTWASGATPVFTTAELRAIAGTGSGSDTELSGHLATATSFIESCLGRAIMSGPRVDYFNSFGGSLILDAKMSGSTFSAKYYNSSRVETTVPTSSRGKQDFGISSAVNFTYTTFPTIAAIGSGSSARRYSPYGVWVEYTAAGLAAGRGLEIAKQGVAMAVNELFESGAIINTGFCRDVVFQFAVDRHLMRRIR